MYEDPKELLKRYEPKQIKVVPQTRESSSARFSPCGKFLLAAGYDGLVHRWNAVGDEFAELPAHAGHNGWVQEVVYHPQQPLYYSADSWGQLRCLAYNEDQPQPKWSVAAAHDGWIQGLAISADGQLIATCGDDRKVRVWSAETGAKVHEFGDHAEQVFRVCFHPDGKSLVSGDLKGIIRQWDLSAGTCTRQFDAGVLFTLNRLQDVGGVRSLVFNLDGSLLVCGGTKPANGGNVQGIPLVLVFDWATGTVKHTHELGKSGDVFVVDLKFQAEGYLMAAVCGNPGAGKLVFRQLDGAEPLYETNRMANCHSLSAHPDGYRLAIVTTNTGSNGNGRSLDKDGKYPGNHSPIFIVDIPRPAPAEPAPATAS